MPKRLEEGDLCLRPVRASDQSFLSEVWKDRKGRRLAHFPRWPLWWWVRRSFTPAYLIECRSREIGFLGLYDLELGSSASFSLYIRAGARGRGLGTRAVRLLCRHLGGHHLVDRLVAEVAADNGTSLAFLHKLGFREPDREDQPGRLQLAVRASRD